MKNTTKINWAEYNYGAISYSALTSDIMVKYDFRLAVLEKSEYYPFEDIGFNLDQWIDWLYYHNYSIEEAAKILDERYNELLLIYASKQKGL